MPCLLTIHQRDQRKRERESEDGEGGAGLKQENEGQLDEVSVTHSVDSYSPLV